MMTSTFLTFILILIPSSASWALTPAILADENNYWQCDTSDQEKNSWSAVSTFKRAAATKAYDRCKKESPFPKTCKTANENCEQFINGRSTRPMWQCTALDDFAKSWSSNSYSHKNDAIFSAKACCEDKSSVPDTCYVNPVTCTNLNAIN